MLAEMHLAQIEHHPNPPAVIDDVKRLTGPHYLNDFKGLALSAYLTPSYMQFGCALSIKTGLVFFTVPRQQKSKQSNPQILFH